MFCASCGNQIPDGSANCPFCGAQQAPAQPPYQQPVYQQPTYQQPTYQQPPAYPQAKIPGRGFGIAGMVCGIIGLILSFFCMIGVGAIVNTYGRFVDTSGLFGEVFAYAILSILALVFGVAARNKGYRTGVAMAGIVLGVIGLALSLISVFMLMV